MIGIGATLLSTNVDKVFMAARAVIKKILRRSVFSTYRKWTIKVSTRVYNSAILRKYFGNVVCFYSTLHPDLKTCYRPLEAVSLSDCDKATLLCSFERSVYTAKPQYYYSNHEIEYIEKNKNKLYSIKSVKVVGSSSLIVYSYSKCINELFFNENDSRYSFVDQASLIAFGDKHITEYKKSKKTINKGILLSGNFSGNYFHLFYEILSRIFYYEKYCIDKNVPYIVDEVVRDVPQYNELFNILNVNKREVIYIAKGFQYDVNELIYLTGVNFIPPHYHDFSKAVYTDCYFDINVLKSLRASMLENKSSRKFPKRIFISRKNASRRRKCNELELYTLLSKHGFSEICPEQYSITEQAAIFNGADFVVGVSGAAFTNLISCKQGCRVLCIVPGYMDLSIFSTIAKVVSADLQYYKPVAGGHNDVAHDSFRISINDFEEILTDWIGPVGEISCP